MSALALLLALVTAACGSTVPAGTTGTTGSGPGSGSAGGGLAGPGRDGSGGSGGAGEQSGGAADGQVTAGTSNAAGTAPSVPAGAGTGSGGVRPQPVDKTTGPVSIGLLYAVNDGAASAGINNGNSITPSQVMHAFVDSWNRSGGFSGRRIDPVYAELHSYNNNYEQQIATACSSFTQDHHVAAVLLQAQYYSDQLLSCLGRAQVPLVSADFDAPDAQDARRYPLYLTPLAMVGDSREQVTVDRMSRNGLLSRSTRVGVLVEDCPVDRRIYTSGLLPALRRAGVPLASTFDAQCFQSLQDFGTQTSQMSSAVLQFRRDGVGSVMVVSQAAEANIVFAFAQVAESQGYRPGYVLTSVAAPNALAQNAPANQLRNMHGLGWLPVNDSIDPTQTPATSTGTRCLQRLRSQGVQPHSTTDLFFAYGACDAFSLYDALLSTTRGATDAPDVLAALPHVAAGYVAASTVQGRVVLHGGRIEPALGRIFGDADGTGFRYTGSPFPL